MARVTGFRGTAYLGFQQTGRSTAQGAGRVAIEIARMGGLCRPGRWAARYISVVPGKSRERPHLMGAILVAGGPGYIGSHNVKYRLERGRDVLVLDDLSGGFRDSVPE